MLRDTGFKVDVVRGVPAPFPKVLGPGVLGRLATRANVFLIKLSKSLFSYQIFVEATTTPGVDFILAQSRLAAVAPSEQEEQGTFFPVLDSKSPPAGTGG